MEQRVFSTNGAGKNGHTNTKKKCRHSPYVFIQIISGWITILNVKRKAIKLLEDNFEESLDDFGFGDDFFDTTLSTILKERIHKLDFIKLNISDLQKTPLRE